MDTSDEISDASSDKTVPFRERPAKKSISQTDKMKLVEAMEKGEDVFKLARQMGIGRNTAKSIIYVFKKTGKIFQGKRLKNPNISEELTQKLLNFVDKNYWLTLEEIRKHLVDQNYEISVYCVSRCLRRNIVAFNKFRSHIAERNSEKVLELRKSYVRRLLEEEWNDNKMIYIDECYFNTWGSKTLSRTKMGVLPAALVPNICFVIAIGVKGIIHHKLLIGSLDKESYHVFINELTVKLNGTGYILIHDNVKSYRENFSTDNQTVNLPPYSSFLSPLDEVFTKIKGNVRQSLSHIKEFTSMNIDNRFVFLNDAINNELKKEDYSNLKIYFKRIRTFFPKAILKEEISGFY